MLLKNTSMFPTMLRDYHLFDNLNNTGAFTNAGLMTVNTAQAHSNTALTNNGIIEYPQGEPDPQCDEQ
jgi:hypothetical protein